MLNKSDITLSYADFFQFDAVALLLLLAPAFFPTFTVFLSNSVIVNPLLNFMVPVFIHSPDLPLFSSLIHNRGPEVRYG